MLVIYIILSLFFIGISIHIHKKIINPITLYNVIWILMVIFYELKLVNYNPLTNQTWYILIISMIMFDLSYIFGNYLASKNKSIIIKTMNSKDILKIIIITSIVSSFAIIPNFISLVKQYGLLNIINSISEVYIDRIEGALYIGYFSPIVNISLLLSGYYFSKYGWNKTIIIPILLSIINAISFGGRNNAIISLLSLLIPIIFSYKFKKIGLKNFIIVFLLFVGFYLIFNIINVERSSVTTISPYANDFIIILNSKFPGIYKIYTYFTTPLGVLNEYLKNPFYSFGANSFLPLYKQFVKLGIEINLQWTLPFYSTPIPSNVGTYLMELIIDFSYVGALIIIFIIGLTLGILFYRAFLQDNFRLQIMFSVIMITMIMSFFMWYFRSINIWIMLLGSYIFTSKRFTNKYLNWRR